MNLTDDNLFSEFLDRLRNGDAKSLFERVDELRSRIVKFLLVMTAFFAAFFSAGRYLFLYLKEPLLAALPEGHRTLNFTGPMEVFMAYMKVAFLVAALFAAPMGFYQLFQFVKPALPLQQRKQIVPYFVASMLLFVGGLAFCYYLMMPAALQYLIGMGGDLVTPVITVDEYTSLMVFMLLGFGAVFQLPVLLIVAEAVGILQLHHLTKHRRIIIIIILVVAAILSPSPDPFSQLAMAIPMYLMFEAAIIIIKLKQKRRTANLPAKVDP